MKLLLAVIVGFVITAVLSTVTDYALHAAGIFPPLGQPMFDNTLLAIAFAYRAIYTVIGAYVAAMIAKEQAMKAVWIIGSIGSAIWFIGTITMWEYAQPWYNIAGVVTGIPLCLFAGMLYEKRKRSQQVENV